MSAATVAAAVLDAASEADARAMLTRCCGSSAWVRGMLERRPFGDDEALVRAAREVWSAATRDDVLEALTHHPRIGASMDELRKRYATTATWSAGEQAGATAADEATLTALRDGNVAYEARYGHIFVVCATGKSAAQMLALLQARMHHEPAEELAIAAAEQGKITEIRLAKLGIPASGTPASGEGEKA